MKRKQKAVLWLLVWICAAILPAGCTGAKKEEEKRSIRIGVSLYRGDDTFINNIRSELENCAKEYEQENGVKVNLFLKRIC